MKAILLPVILLLLGTGAGVGAGIFLMPPPEQESAEGSHDCVDPNTLSPDQITVAVDVTSEREFAKLNNQFIVPVVEDGLVAALVVLSLNLEVTVGSRQAIFTAEPKIRDRFLQVMFDHANTGGFSGNFTTGVNMGILRDDLLRAAQDVSGQRVTDVLVIDIVRQDV